MRGTRWAPLMRDFLGQAHRELRISLTRYPRGKKWIFVVGCYNSGTTLLSSLIAASESVSELPDEGQYYTDQLPRDFELGLSRMWVLREDIFHLSEASIGPDADRLKREWLMRLDRNKDYFLEKTPANSARTRWLQKYFEDAHFIVITRDPYAVCEGIRRKARPSHRTDGWSIAEAAYQWRRCQEVLLEDSRFLKRCLWVRYEDLVEAPRSELQRIGEFLQLEKEIPFQASSEWTIHGETQNIANLNAKSIARLSAEDLQQIDNVISEELMEKFGYMRTGSVGVAAGLDG